MPSASSENSSVLFVSSFFFFGAFFLGRVCFGISVRDQVFSVLVFFELQI